MRAKISRSGKKKKMLPGAFIAACYRTASVMDPKRRQNADVCAHESIALL